MKLRNKKTGEIAELGYIASSDGFIILQDVNTEEFICKYKSLAELNAEWEDTPEEPKKHYEILAMGAVMEREDAEDEIFRNQGQREIGNYFETKEEAEKAVEKLKAIQRLKSHYIKFKLDFVKNKIDFTYRIDGTLHSSVDEERIIFEDLDLLFGGEE